MSTIRDFGITYAAYAEFSARWSATGACWLRQNNFESIAGRVLRDNVVRPSDALSSSKVPSMPMQLPGSRGRSCRDRPDEASRSAPVSWRRSPEPTPEELAQEMGKADPMVSRAKLPPPRP